MTLTRRQFAIRTTQLLGAMAVLPYLAGCPGITQTQLASLISEVGAGLQEILPYLKSVDAATAAKIELAFSALETAVQNWKPGSAVAVIEEAVNAFVGAMAIIPVLASYQPLVALIVATAEGLLALPIPAPPAGTTTAFAHATPGVGVTHEHGHVVVSYQGITISNPPKTAAAFRSSWNKAVKGDAKLTGLAIT